MARSYASRASRSKSQARTSSAWPIQTSKFALIHDAGKIPSQLRLVRHGLHRLAHRQRADVRVVLDPLVKLAAGIPCRCPGNIPTHFRRRESGSQSPSDRRFPITDRADAPVQVLRGGFRAHAAVDEADQIGQVMVAEKTAHLLFAALERHGV